MPNPFAILDQPEIRQVLFHPRRAGYWAPPGGAAKAVAMEMDDGVSVGGYLYNPRRQANLILYFHGNGELAVEYGDIAELYAAIGATLLVMDYRGYGDSGGTPSAETLVADARTIWGRLPGLLTDLALEPNRVFVMGRSLGSASALEIAARDEGRLDGLILESAFARSIPLIERLAGVKLPEAMHELDGFDNIDKMAKVRCPALLIHGTNDTIIPVGDGRDLVAAGTMATKQLVEIAGAGHNDLMYVGQQQYFFAIRDFIGAGT